MHVISIFNNKGGVGKSTLTVALAEFLSANRNKSVLVIDLDAQASSAGSLLDTATMRQAIREKRTIVELTGHIKQYGRLPTGFEKFFVDRQGTGARGSGLRDIAVLLPDRSALHELEERLKSRKDDTLLLRILKPALMSYDFVLIDTPGNVDRRQKLVMNGLAMSDFVLVPTKPDQISLAAFPDTFDIIHSVQEMTASGRPSILGIVRNMTDRRTQQYRAKFPTIIEAAAARDLPQIFTNFLPNHPALESATDVTRDARTLKERFGSDYDAVRKLAVELERRCNEFEFVSTAPRRRNYTQVIGKILDRFSRKHV